MDQIFFNIGLLLEYPIVNLKIMYLVIEELKTDQVTLPPTTSDLAVFVQGCIKEIQSQSPGHKTFLKEYTDKDFKKLLKKLIKTNPTKDSSLRWLFGLELSELGEKLEHWFFDQLLPLKDNTLRHAVVLSSVTFLTDVKSRKHQGSENPRY